MMREKSVLCNFARRRMVEEFWKLVHRNVGLVEIRFCSFAPLLLPLDVAQVGNEGRRAAAGPSLITSGPWTSAGIGGNEINFYFEKFPSFHRGQLETWGGEGTMGSIEWLREIEFGEVSLGPTDFTDFYRVLENEQGW